jgi:hypothetical protein
MQPPKGGAVWGVWVLVGAVIALEAVRLDPAEPPGRA